MLRAGIARAVAAKKERRIGGVPEGYDAFLLSQSAYKAVGPIVHICRDDARLDLLQKALAFFAPNLKVSIDKNNTIDTVKDTMVRKIVIFLLSKD